MVLNSDNQRCKLTKRSGKSTGKCRRGGGGRKPKDGGKKRRRGGEVCRKKSEQSTKPCPGRLTDKYKGQPPRDQKSDETKKRWRGASIGGVIVEGEKA